MAYVSEDLVTEILLRLPIKSLLKCLCVCKRWRSLIRSPSFIDQHLKSARDCMVFCEKFRERYGSCLSYYCLDNNVGAIIPLPNPPCPAFADTYFSLMLCGPYHGIFCVVASKLFARKVDMFLCNPATRECRRLPKPLRAPPEKNHYRARGLGMDPSSKDYKVVFLLHLNERYDERKCRVEIYNLRSNSWREFETGLPEVCKGSLSKNGLFFDRYLHWTLWKRNSIFRFDITDEVIVGQIALPQNVVPEDMEMRENDVEVVELEGCLALAVMALPADRDRSSVYHGPCSLFVWKMMGGSWMKRFTISIPNSGWRVYPISSSKEDVLFLVQNGRTEDLISISLGQEEEDDSRVKTHNLNRMVTDVMVLKESLVSVR